METGVGALLLPVSAIWAFAPDKVLAVRQDWAAAHPDRTARLIRAVWRAGRNCLVLRKRSRERSWHLWRSRRNQGGCILFRFGPKVIGRHLTSCFSTFTGLAGHPLAATIGYGTSAHIVTPFSMDLNGNAITMSNEAWDLMKPQVPLGADGLPEHPISATALTSANDQFAADGKPFNLGILFPVSTHNYELRYWLAAGGINPGLYSADDVSGTIGADVLLSVTPPPQMPATLEAACRSG